MKRLLLLFALIQACLGAAAQKSLAIDIAYPWRFKRLHIYQGELMTFRLKGDRHLYRHTLVDMQDSVLYIETGESIRLDRLRCIIIDRSNFLTRMLASGFRTAGIGYVAIDAFNNSINGETPVFKERVVLTGAGLFLVGQAIRIANKKRLRTGRYTSLKVIDLGVK